MIYRHKMPYSGGCCGITLHKTVLIAGLSKQNCCRHTLSPKILRPEISNPAPLPPRFCPAAALTQIVSAADRTQH